MQQVHVLCISHRHGVNLSVHYTEAGAKAKLLEYVREEWAREMEGSDMPEDGDEAIDIYFDNVDEQYDITEAGVQP